MSRKPPSYGQHVALRELRFTPALYGSPEETTMAAAFAGVRFTGSITGNKLTIFQYGSGLAIIGTMQPNIFLRGVGHAAALVSEGTKVVAAAADTSLPGDTWTINKTYSTPVVEVGMYGGLI